MMKPAEHAFASSAPTIADKNTNGTTQPTSMNAKTDKPNANAPTGNSSCLPSSLTIKKKIFYLSKNDVLCGRGKFAMNSSGIFFEKCLLNKTEKVVLEEVMTSKDRLIQMLVMKHILILHVKFEPLPMTLVLCSSYQSSSL